MPHYTVRQGDCISSIAHKNGHFWEKVWNHPSNGSLRATRKDPNVLLPGDVVFVPDKEEKTESGATDTQHRFKKKGVPAKLRLRLCDDDEPRANQAYTLEIDGKVFRGTTDGEGRIEQAIAPDSKKGKLTVGDAGDEYVLNLGHIDPVDEISGVQARLNNMGFDCGPADGRMGPRTRMALREFQKSEELDETGEIDDETRQRLSQEFGA